MASRHMVTYPSFEVGNSSFLWQYKKLPIVNLNSFSICTVQKLKQHCSSVSIGNSSEGRTIYRKKNVSRKVKPTSNLKRMEYQPIMISYIETKLKVIHHSV
jgi:hypothetical protein